MSTIRWGGAKRGALGTAALASLVVWGCEGTHLFVPITVGPQIIDLSIPASVQSGDSMSVAVSALGLVRVDSIVATVRIGSFEQTQVARQAGILSGFSAAFDFPIPTAVSDTRGTVEAYAVDAQHNVGPLSSITLRTVDTAPPAVAISIDSPTIGVGTQIEVTIAAQDNIGLSEVGFQILDLQGDTIAEVRVPETGSDIVTSLLYTVPFDLELGQAVVVGIAVDHAGLVTMSLPVPIALTDVDIPEVEVLTPDTGALEPAQEPVFAQIRIHDNDAVDSVRIDGVAHRGSPTLGTDTVVVRFLPTVVAFGTPISDTILQRNLAPSADSTKETAYIRAVAYDRHGNVSRDSVEISLLIDDVPPFVEIRSPIPGSIKGIGDSILVESFFWELTAPIMSGVRTLELEGLAFRGDPELGTFNTVPRFNKRTITFDPPDVSPNGLLVRRFLTATSDATSEPVHIIATATDAWGNARADTVQIRVVHDTIPPTIIIEAPVAGSGQTVGDSTFIRATAFEPEGPDQSGVASISFDGVSYRFNPGFARFDQFLKYTARTFNFFPSPTLVGQGAWLQPTGDTTLETVWLRVIARDQLGNTSIDSVNVMLTP